MREFIDPSTDHAHFAFDDVGSTNDEAFRLAQERGLGTFFVTARRQLAGRGRRGRPWVSEAGNLYASVFLRSPARNEVCAQLSFVAAISLQRAIADVTDDSQGLCRLKWPNDVLWDGAKLAGLLLEARANGSDSAFDVVIGMGVNCQHHPDDTPYPASNLASLGHAVSPDALFERLRHWFYRNVTLWDRGHGFDTIRKTWLDHAHGLGEPIVVRLESGDREGFFKTVDGDGHLVLSQVGAPDKLISAGDVFFDSKPR